MLEFLRRTGTLLTMKTSIVSAGKTTIAQAGRLIATGELVAFPTETVFGLGADALNETAVAKIFVAKDRPADNPLIIHIADLSSLELVTSFVPQVAQKLIDAFWPGPLSIVLPKHSRVPAVTTAGLDTVVVRYPSHPVAQALIHEAGTPIAAPSANRSGRVSPTTAKDVFTDMNGKIPLILDAEAIKYGLESTVIDCTTDVPTLLRPGSITQEMIESIIGAISTTSNTETRSPGMKYRHYATDTPITLLTGTAKQRQQKYQTFLESHEPNSFVLLSHTLKHSHTSYIQLPSKCAAAGTCLYSTLILADTQDKHTILIEGYLESGVGTAIMNRLRKAATNIL